MKSTEELIHEHTIILHLLTDVERLAQSILTTHIVDVATVKDIIDFSRNFTDGCHHSKEEKHLFVRLEEKGMPKEQGPIAVMLNEHQVGRELIRQIETALQEYEKGKKDANDIVGQSMLRYVKLLRAHIAKENNILFPMADRLLSAEDQQFLEKSFKIVEEQDIGAGVHEKYHHMAHEIAE